MHKPSRWKHTAPAPHARSRARESAPRSRLRRDSRPHPPSERLGAEPRPASRGSGARSGPVQMQRCTPAPHPPGRAGCSAAGSPGKVSAAARAPHLAEAPLRRRLRGPLVVVARAEQQPHGTQEADQEAPAAVHSRRSRQSLGALQSRPWGAGRASADEARAGPARAPPPGRLPGPPSAPRPLSGRHLPAEPADVPGRPRRASSRFPASRARLTSPLPGPARRPAAPPPP